MEQEYGLYKNDINMILTVNGNIVKLGDSIAAINSDNDIRLTFTVKGSYFPARRSSASPSYLYLYSQMSVDNIVYIDYNDGTGEHAYNFRSSGSNRRLRFFALNNATTPQTIANSSTYDVSKALYPPYGLHFYQDLPDDIKNTVNDDYEQYRTVSIRFQKPQSITYLQFSNVLLYDSLPSPLSKLNNLETLAIANSQFIEFFAQDFVSSRIRRIIMSNLGSVFNNGFANWMFNSPAEEINLQSSIDLSGSASSKKFNRINEVADTLEMLNLADTGINYPMPQELAELYKLQTLTLNNNTSPAMRFPADVSGLLALDSVGLSGTRMPFSEIERIIQGLPSLKTLSITLCEYNADYDFTENNGTLESINIGNQTWNGGAIPSFINKLAALKTLNAGSSNTSPVSFPNSYGNFANCVNLETLGIYRLSNFPTTIPTWLNGLTKLKYFNAYATYLTITRMDAFVNNIYDFVVANAPITGTSSSPFRNMVINVYGATAADYANAVKPSGTFQAPAGFIAGSSNGMPATPFEKIYCLTFNYNHLWNVKST